MKKSYRIAFLLVFLTSPLMLLAQQVSSELAKQKALTFLTKSDKSSTNRSASIKTPRLVLANDRDEFYVFNDEANGGYVVVSGDERMPDVLGYSYTGHFDAEDIPCNMRAWLEDYANQVIYLRSHPEAQVTRTSFYDKEEISPLLKCHFAQSKFYNDKCPLVKGDHSLTGCVATAMAQIMYYYQWPKQTTDIIPGYTTKTKSIEMPAIPVTTIDWDNMLEQYNSEEDYSDKQIDAISTLMLLCGTSTEMDYDMAGSGAYLSAVATALHKYFGYDYIAEYVEAHNMGIWRQIIYEELNSGRPVLYGGEPFKSMSNHAFVIDGFRGGFFHVNWGWGGSSDDYFQLTDVIGYFSKTNNGAIIGIQPAYPDSPSRYAVLDNGKMTLYYDKEMSHRTGTILPYKEEWSNYTEQITECVIDPSFVNLEMSYLRSLFFYWNKLKSIKGLENINTSKVIDINSMFRGCSSLSSLDLSGFNTENVQDMSYMFYGCSSLTNLDLSGLKTDNLSNMRSMFQGCSNLKNLDLSGFKTDKAASMVSMFEGCSSLTNLNLSCFNTIWVDDMSGMFQACSSLTNLDLSGFKTDYVLNMEYMFSGCSNLTSLDVSGFETGNVWKMKYMFSGCSNLTSLDLSSFTTYSVTDMECMFSDCSNLTTIYASEHWDMSNVYNANNMFSGCNSLIGGAGTTYDNSSTTSDADYAHLDGGPENPGYFTYKHPNFYTITWMIGDKVFLVQTYEFGETIQYQFPPSIEGYTFEWSDYPATMPEHDLVIYGIYTLGIIDLLEEKHPVKVFSLEGRSQNKMQKGINIIRYSDGSVRKVLVK